MPSREACLATARAGCDRSRRSVDAWLNRPRPLREARRKGFSSTGLRSTPLAERRVRVDQTFATGIVMTTRTDRLAVVKPLGAPEVSDAEDAQTQPLARVSEVDAATERYATQRSRRRAVV